MELQNQELCSCDKQIRRRMGKAFLTLGTARTKSGGWKTEDVLAGEGTWVIYGNLCKMLNALESRGNIIGAEFTEQ